MTRALATTLLLAATAMAQPRVGDIAPDFTLQSLNHGEIKSSNYRGKVVYLFFMGHN
ncbi:MAG: redoxin domain-containing protein [bacterium]